MKLNLYQIDAFTDQLFGGNPAAVIPLQNWIDEKLMQKISLENNLSETVFFVPRNDNAENGDFDIRWFTPTVEINLCGHATLASAFVLFNILNFDKPVINFNSQSGVLRVTKKDGFIDMDFPSWEPEIFNNPPLQLKDALGGVDILGIYKNRDLLILLKDEYSVKNCAPDFSLIHQTGYKIIITATGNKVDFVSRFFAPTAGVDEDPVTGSAHSQLIPFWSKKLNKTKMDALQLSKRGGEIFCEQHGDRVTMSGRCVFYMKGEIEIS
ncbi:MAG TPA: PhzF family phenazine biosynthesis protein [Chitinophagaceae bacterium]|nr:PhzF family phenazine biosynthesis protein [Chitinophagaceae bacterium]